MKKRNDLTLKEAIAAMLRENRLDEPMREKQVRAVWDRLMGEAISTYTTEVSLRQGVLCVRVISAPLRQELSLARDKIRKLINEEMGEACVREVVIR